MKLVSFYFVDEMPQHIRVSSNIAIYHPYDKNIYIRKDLKCWYMFTTVTHELIHYFIDLLPLKYEKKDKLQKNYDKFWSKYIEKPKKLELIIKNNVKRETKRI